MWHPHLKRKRISEVNLEIIDLKRNDISELWKMFDNLSKENSFFNKNDNEKNFNFKKMNCECKFVKTFKKTIDKTFDKTEVDTNLKFQNINLNPNVINLSPTMAERNKLKSLLLQRNKNSNHISENENKNQIQLRNMNDGNIESKYESKSNFLANNYRLKEIPIDGQSKNNYHSITYDPNETIFPDIKSYKNTKNNLHQLNDLNFPQMNSFLQSKQIPSSQDKEKINFLTESEGPSEILNYKNILSYLRLNSLLIKNLENIVLTKSEKDLQNNSDKGNLIKTDNNNVEVHNSNENFDNNLGYDSNFFNKNHPNQENKFLNNNHKNFINPYNSKYKNDESFIKNKNKIIHNESESLNTENESSDLLQIVKNLNLNINNPLTPSSMTKFDFLNLPQIDFTKYKEFLK